MGLGVLEPRTSEHVPGLKTSCILCQKDVVLTRSAGTSFVLDDASRPTLSQDTDAKLKYDRRGAIPIILVPQPSDDPNDPLVGSLEAYKSTSSG